MAMNNQRSSSTAPDQHKSSEFGCHRNAYRNVYQNLIRYSKDLILSEPTMLTSHHCPICGKQPSPACQAKGHVAACEHCGFYWVPNCSKQCPRCKNQRQKEEIRRKSEEEKKAKITRKASGSSNKENENIAQKKKKKGRR